MSQLLRTKSIDALIAASAEPGRQLHRSLGPWSLVALGIGAVIGSGIFVLTGTAAAGETHPVPSILHAPVLDILRHGGETMSTLGRPGAGPAIWLSFLLAAFGCGLAGLCYAELASMIPVAGSAYTYTYATLGELFAWIIGWDLILEYAVSNMAVAVGFSAYFNDMLDGLFGVHLPLHLSRPTFMNGEYTGSFNLPALCIVLLLTWILTRGVRESARANNAMVIVKVAAILIFVFAGYGAVNAENWTPQMPNGLSGVLTGSAIVFFTYIGFDSVSTAGEECRNPKRDLPFGIIVSLIVCSSLYIAVSVVLTGMQNWTALNNAAPVANALKAAGLDSARRLVTVGALGGMLSSLLVFQYGQARIWFAMSRDGLLPGIFSHVHPRYLTPYYSTWIAGFAVAIPAGMWDIGIFAELSNIGTLFAFGLVSAAVLVLRKKQPERARGFRVPLVPFVPVLAIGFCLVLMMSLPLLNWIGFILWLIVGLVIYFGFGRKRSVLAEQK
ncbi:MAG: amino acid permease [Bryobacteraceae bacterium]|nr:amino acid permease [Bryobacteraceae bacterium]